MALVCTNLVKYDKILIMSSNLVCDTIARVDLDAETESTLPQVEIAEYPILNTYIDSILSGSRQPRGDVARQLGISTEEVGRIVNKRCNQKYIQSKMSLLCTEADVERLQVLLELKSIAFTSIDELADFDGYTLQFKDWHKVPRHILRSIAEAKVIRSKDQDDIVVFKMYDKLRALDILSRVLKMQEESIKINATVEHQHRLFDGTENKTSKAVGKHIEEALSGMVIDIDTVVTESNAIEELEIDETGEKYVA